MLLCGPIASDSHGGGVATWYTYDLESFDGSGHAYYDGSSALTTSALADIATGGWAMRAYLRVNDMIADGGNEQPDQAPGLQVALAGSQQWAILKLGQDSSGNTTAQVSAGYNADGSLNNSSIITVSGSGYHNFELLGEPTGSLVDLYVDGTKVISGISDANLNAGFAAALGNRVFWGCADTPGVGIGYYNSVQFETAPAPIPEPSTLILLGYGLVGLLAYAWRKRR